MRRRAVVIAATALAAGVVAPSAHAAFTPPRSCASGEGEFRDGRTRIFSVEGSIDGYQAWRYYVCSAQIRKPRRFYETSPGLDETFSTFRASGRRVAFLLTLIGGESFDQVLGWVDLRSARLRLTHVSRQGFVRAVVADEAGGIAYLQEGYEYPRERIGYARIGPRGFLGRPHARAVVAEGDVIPRSLAVANGTITWTTRSGAVGSVATSG